MGVAYQDYYETLGVSRDASQEDIQRAYRKLARKYHPDVSKEPNASDRFKAINEAYEVLKDPENRKKYDLLGNDWKTGQDFNAPGFENLFQQFGGQGGRGGSFSFQSGGGGDRGGS